MPVITIHLTAEGATAGTQSITAEQKAQLISGVTQVLVDVLAKPPDTTYVIIDEVPLDNWGWGGLPTAQYREKRKTL